MTKLVFACLGIAFIAVAVFLLSIEIPLEHQRFAPGLSSNKPTPFVDGHPLPCEEGGFTCYYDWGVSDGDNS